MEKNLFIALAAVAAVTAVSCSKVETAETPSTVARITAYTDASEVKTSLSGTSVLWDENDSISIFTENGNSKFKIVSLSEDKKQAVFEGSDQVPASSVAIYPYNSKASCTESVVSGVIFPTVQEAVAGGFANGSNPSVALADNSGNLYFKNLGALVSFTITESDIDWVIIETDVNISGTANVTVGETPSVSFSDGQKYVKLAGDFENGKTYFAVIAPSTVDTLKLIFHKAATGALITGTAKSAKAFVRNGNYILGSISIAAEKWTKGIWDDKDLLAFGSAVTAGESIEAYKEKDVVNLWRDVDLGNVQRSKSIIGHVQWGVSSNIYNVTANESKVFKGVFNGNGNTVSGLNISISSLGNMMPAGLFGVVKDATIQNLNVTGTGIYAVATSAKVAIGPVVGLAISSTIENCSSNCTRLKARLQSNNGSNQRMGIGGIVGIINECTLKNCVNNSRVGIINGSDTGEKTNTNNGADGGSMAGICGFTSGSSSNTIFGCTNNGQVGGYETKANIGGGCRIGGIVGTILKNTTVENCVNNGLVEGTLKVSSDKSSRTAGIASYIDGTSSALKNCENNGKVCYSTPHDGGTHYYGYCGGIAGQFAQPVTVDGCKNYGDVLTDNFTESDSDKNATGIIIARPNTKAATIKNCIIGGRIGGYNDSSTIVTLTADNYSSYISGDTDTRKGKLVINDCSFGTK